MQNVRGGREALNRRRLVAAQNLESVEQSTNRLNKAEKGDRDAEARFDRKATERHSLKANLRVASSW